MQQHGRLYQLDAKRTRHAVRLDLGVSYLELPGLVVDLSAIHPAAPVAAVQAVTFDKEVLQRAWPRLERVPRRPIPRDKADPTSATADTFALVIDRAIFCGARHARWE